MTDTEGFMRKAVLVTDLSGNTLFYSPDCTIEPVTPKPSLEDVLTDVIDAYVMENYGYLSGDKEAGYSIDGYIGPRFLAQKLIEALEAQK